MTARKTPAISVGDFAGFQIHQVLYDSAGNTIGSVRSIHDQASLASEYAVVATNGNPRHIYRAAMGFSCFTRKQLQKRGIDRAKLSAAIETVAMPQPAVIMVGARIFGRASKTYFGHISRVSVFRDGDVTAYTNQNCHFSPKELPTYTTGMRCH